MKKIKIVFYCGVLALISSFVVDAAVAAPVFFDEYSVAPCKPGKESTGDQYWIKVNSELGCDESNETKCCFSGDNQQE